MFKEVAFLCCWFPPELGGGAGQGRAGRPRAPPMGLVYASAAERQPRRSKRARRVMLWG